MREDNSNTYIPGNCNLGSEEVKRRFRIGYFGLIVSVFLIIALYLLNAPREWRLLLFIPAFYSLSGFIQAKNKFCYIYGFKNVFSLKGKRNFTRVTNLESKIQDRRKAFWIVTITLILSALVTMLFYIIN